MVTFSKRTFTSFITIALISINFKLDAQLLNSRLNKYVKALKINYKTEADCIKNLRKYYLPIDNVDSLCSLYYTFTQCNIEVKNSLTKLKVEDTNKFDKNYAKVYLSYLLIQSNGDKFNIVLETYWIRILVA